jgi:hypothetical protein
MMSDNILCDLTPSRTWRVLRAYLLLRLLAGRVVYISTCFFRYSRIFHFFQRSCCSLIRRAFPSDFIPASLYPYSHLVTLFLQHRTFAWQFPQGMVDERPCCSHIRDNEARESCAVFSVH